MDFDFPVKKPRMVVPLTLPTKLICDETLAPLETFCVQTRELLSSVCCRSIFIANLPETESKSFFLAE